ncbi:MAG: YggS family pyridoxal phosphate-dependent enzyme [Sedimentisphaerales bacterium]|nr:YggS family pyridoxal phosphate-dependent enzyme [Sedimentisphaerales bacterium]
MSIAENYKRLRQKIPDDVTILLAVKKRTPQELVEAIEAGATDIGENYVQEAGQMYNALREKVTQVKWHMIGCLQTNKINTALSIFDVIQTVDSLEQAEAINKRVIKIKKQVIPIYMEINIGNEDFKAGIRPDEHEPFEDYMENLVRDISQFGHLRVEGLMTMGPRFGNPEDVRPYFKRTKRIFNMLKSLDLPNVSMKYLSMGMTNSYKVAIEEGSNMVRIGTAVFGERPYSE